MIKGKEAWIAYFENIEVQYLYDGKWHSMNNDFNDFSVCDFQKDTVKFRIKPRTITINGIEVPAPFEPKEDERFYYFSDEYTTGYASATKTGFYGDMKLGAWRTEEEIKQVVEALWSIFK